MNLTAIQTWAIVLQTGVFALQTGVLIKTLSAVRKQATASNAEAAAATNQANMTIKQLYASIAQADFAARPLLSLVWQEKPYGHFMDVEVRNDGLGPAFNIAVFFEENVIDEQTFSRIAIPLSIEFLGVGKTTTFSVSLKKLAFQNLVVEYHSALNSTFETRLAFATDGEHHYQTERLREQSYAALADEEFRSLFSSNGLTHSPAKES
jgi:hypothetical protein